MKDSNDYDMLIEYIEQLLLREPSSNTDTSTLDIASLSDEYKDLARILTYMGDSVSEMNNFADKLSKGNFETTVSKENIWLTSLIKVQKILSALVNKSNFILSDQSGMAPTLTIDRTENLTGEFATIAKALDTNSLNQNNYIPILSMDLLDNKNKMIHDGISQQISHYERLVELSEEVRRVRHDIRNHLLCLDSLIADNQSDKAREYIMSITPTVYTSQIVLNTNNYIFDALMSEKIRSAKRNGIRVDNKISIGRKLSINNVDWCILFGNAMDNAIEACERVYSDEKVIEIDIVQKGNTLNTHISNTMHGRLKKEGDLFLSSKRNLKAHGFGLKNITQTVEKYDGVYDFETEENWFILSFILFGV